MVRFDRISSNPARMNGQPCIRDLRITVRRVLEALSTFRSVSAVLVEYPELDEEDVRQALAYASSILDDEVVEFSRGA